MFVLCVNSSATPRLFGKCILSFGLAQVIDLSCGKLSYLYRCIGNEKTRLMKVTYLLTYLVIKYAPLES